MLVPSGRAGHPGVVDQHIDLAKLTDRFRHHTAHGFRVGNVRRDPHRANTHRCDLRRRTLAGVGVDV